MRKRIRSATVLAAALVLTAVVGAVVAFAENIDPFDAGDQYAWGENVGWLNAEPSGNGGPGVHVYGDHLEGYMWGENIGWVNMSCQNTGNCAGPAGNWGVTNDGAGNLAGYAWGESVGWISFSCRNRPSTCAATGHYGVTINPTTGVFSGYAWGENIGWISFSDNAPVAYGVKTSWRSPCTPGVDSDGDGWKNDAEWAITTDCLDSCTNQAGDRDAWPPDLNKNKVCDITDAGLFLAAFPSAEGSPNYSPRKNMRPESPGVIDITDAGWFFGHFPGVCT